MQHFHRVEAGLAHPIELIHERSWRVFALDISEYGVAISGVFEFHQVVAVALPQETAHGGPIARHEIENPKRAARPQSAMKRGEHGAPLLVGSQVMECRRGDDHIGRLLAEFQFANIALERRDDATRGGRYPLSGSVEHRPTEIDQRDIAVGQPLEQFESIVAGPATDIDDVSRPGRSGGRGGGHELER